MSEVKICRSRIDLSGIWKFSFDASYKDTITLPGTTEMNKKGAYAPDTAETLFLSRKYPFTGKAYYQREVEIPEEWKKEKIFLYLERTKYTRVYVNDREVSFSGETIIPQEHDLTEALQTGKNIITIVVDNNLETKDDFAESLMRGHQYTDHTQTNWNGIQGDLYLECRNPVFLKEVQTIGDVHENSIHISAELNEWVEGMQLTIDGLRSDGISVPEHQFHVKDEKIYAVYPLERMRKNWDEFHPFFYELSLRLLVDGKMVDQYNVRAYMQKKEIREKRLYVNEFPLSLRGTVDCCIFPQTGAPPMDVEHWRQIYQLIKSYGFNHYRFHSWCPPRAAFEAADQEGIYLQIELPNFANAFHKAENPAGDQVLHHFLWDQSEKLLKVYGNHPSFLIFAVGNEMLGDLAAFTRLTSHLRTIRPDKFYTQGANNFLEDPLCDTEDDCWIIMRTDKVTNIRASFSYSDVPLGYLQTEEKPSTLHNYDQGIAQSPIPLIAHEIGQYQMAPDYKEIEKYKGVLSPENLKIFRRRLEEAGMLDQADIFFRASGALAVQCYREDIEAQLRTDGLTGFQALGLQDFSGQGTALVGILDSFLDSKGLITAERWRQFCGPRVLLAEFSRYVWTEGEDFEADVRIYNYGKEQMNGCIQVTLENEEGDVWKKSRFECAAKKGGNTQIGHVKMRIPQIERSHKAVLRLEYDASIQNEYPIWIYKEKLEIDSGEIIVTKYLTKDIMRMAEGGRSVLLMSDQADESYSVEGSFAPDFWCYPMFKGAAEDKGLPVSPGTLGMLCEKEHPVFCDFPTESYSQWQWHTLLYHSRPVILDGLEDTYRPLVQIIDNFDRNHKLGFLFEGKLGKGKILVCTCDLDKHMKNPEVRQFAASILKYMNTESFSPDFIFSENWLYDIFQMK